MARVVHTLVKHQPLTQQLKQQQQQQQQQQQYQQPQQMKKPSKSMKCRGGMKPSATPSRQTLAIVCWKINQVEAQLDASHHKIRQIKQQHKLGNPSNQQPHEETPNQISQQHEELDQISQQHADIHQCLAELVQSFAGEEVGTITPEVHQHQQPQQQQQQQPVGTREASELVASWFPFTNSGNQEAVNTHMDVAMEH